MQYILHTYAHSSYAKCTLFASVSSQDVSCGASGELPVEDAGGTPLEPITVPFSEYPGDGTVKGPLCAANIHSHIGAEHRSSGQGDASYEDNFDSENGPQYISIEKPGISGKRCNFYKNRKDNELDFSNYDFKHCADFKVGMFIN